MIVSWDCFEGWEGFSLWSRDCDRPPVGDGVVVALPPRKGFGTEQAVSVSRARSREHGARSLEKGEWGECDEWEL